MQDQYFGDEGDFVKFRLLRQICGMRANERRGRLSLGVVWYLVENEGGKDGGRTAYLESDEYMEADPDLHTNLKSWVDLGDERAVSLIEESKLFPKETTAYYSDIVPKDGRSEWLDTALKSTAEREVIFLDPDNGLAPPSVKEHYKKSRKHVFGNEIKRFCQSKQTTLVMYQHVRRVRAMVQLADQIAELLKWSGRDLIVPVMHHKLSRRLFYLLPGERKRQVVLNRIHEMRDMVHLRVIGG